MLCPQCPAGIVWNDLTAVLYALIKRIAEEENADLDRISMTGLSMGGFGTWEFGMRYADLLCAIAPICGGGMAWRAEALKAVPVQAYHGDADNVVAPSYSFEMVNALRRAGGQVTLTVFNGVGHDSWNPAYRTTNALEFLLSQRRGCSLLKK